VSAAILSGLYPDSVRNSLNLLSLPSSSLALYEVKWQARQRILRLRQSGDGGVLLKIGDASACTPAFAGWIARIIHSFEPAKAEHFYTNLGEEETLNRPKIIASAETSFAVIVWGASFVATKISLRYISAVTVVWLRFAIGFTILGAAVYLREQFAFPTRKELFYFATLGLLGITFHQWLQSTGLITAQATTTAWIVATTPIFMALLGWLLLNEKLGWVNWGGIVIAAVGVLLVVSRGDLAAFSTGKFGTPGDFLILISAPNWAVFSVLSRRGLQDHPAARMMFYVMGFGWLFTTVLLVAGPGLGEIGDLALQGWLGVGFLGIFCSGLAYIAWYDALKVIPAAQVGAFLYFEPLVTVIVAALVLGEPLLWVSLSGGGIILAGVWLVNRRVRSSQP
jgi:drug/metabolite transporter (DMT)-like permease